MLESLLFPDEARYCYLRSAISGSSGIFGTGDSSLGNKPNLANYEQLHPLEQALVSQAVDSRKAEFGDARWCAHQALQELGLGEASPILRGERGMPLWPEGYVGSITHTNGFRAAVVAPGDKVRSIGLDAEPTEPLPPGVLEAIARPAEARQVEELKAAGIFYADKLLFCAKEATYKAWFPLTERFLDFDEAEIDIRLDGTLTSRILSHPTPVAAIEGSWLARDGYAVVSAVVPV
ncbi:4'-phosphopantetheinyl transferase [Corynebacterium phocae]|uniref:4'-phosphopantetheinyl transferase n=1 Tax=Corynebacterium phocae TaxID=161895 RepID=A0A1L7D2J0_9CORY|nr:4'-phosphopantetheinyl transferase superfamily protein [Corynebacterium phocae]APT92344.1 4'-phosphopantetheinyl transferase [Corynebacterium phocae]KAA8724936.1 4'-phosphopantetheinyl transferase superfamily protein [Corynebacterium phocae]